MEGYLPKMENDSYPNLCGSPCSLPVSQPQTYLEALMRGSASLSPIIYEEPRTNEESQDIVHQRPSETSEDLDGKDDCPSYEAASGSNLRKRSVSFSLDPPNRHISPLRAREHSSEAGSPTFEQVLLMSQKSPIHEAGKSSLVDGTLAGVVKNRSDVYASSLLSSSYSPGKSDSSPEVRRPTTRPSLSDMVDIDLAVAHAVQNLQKLQQQQAQLYSGFGASSFPPQSSNSTYDSLSRSSNDQGISILNSILSSVAQNNTSSPYDHGVGSIIHSEGVQQNYSNLNSIINGPSDPLALERAARQYRSAASVCEASCTWSGQLPPRSSTAGPNSSYSTKIFLGGVPWDISEQTLIQAFAEFGDVRVEWPGRDYTSPPKGYLYLVFQEEGDVTDLLAKCSQDYNTRDSYYYKISSRRMRSKEVQIIPWVLTDSNFIRCPSPRLDPQKTVFVGALHGMMTAQGLALVFNDLFGGVVYAGLDTDKFKYPIGSGRVTFNNNKSYMKAVAAAFIEIKTPRFCKKVQVDPYLEDTLCSVCGLKQGPYFCRELECFNYFCHGCWDDHHKARQMHKPLMRNIRGLTRARSSHQIEFPGRYRVDPVRDLSAHFGQSFRIR